MTTDVIVSVGIFDEDELERFVVDCDSFSGTPIRGVLDAVVCVGSFIYLNEETLIEKLKSINWYDYEEVQLWIRREGRFVEVDLRGENS